ncbi:MAG: hypothetical protein ACOCVA_05135 [Prolixibacteraceae bacterium]
MVLLILIILVVTSFIGLAIFNDRNHKKKLNDLQKEKELKIKEYLTVKRQINIPNNSFQVYLLYTLNMDEKLVLGENYVWRNCRPL